MSVRRYLADLVLDLPGIVLAAVLGLPLPFALFAWLLEKAPMP